MTVTSKDLRFNTSFLLSALDKGEDITITHRGKPKAKLVSCAKGAEKINDDDELFGIWSDKEMDVDACVREMRKGRKF